MLHEILELPWIKPKGSKKIRAEQKKYTDIRRQGPRNLLHKRRTMRETTLRGIASGDENASIIRDDRRYRIPETVIKPATNAVVFYMMDVSGSMGVEERQIVRYLCALCSFWLAWNYNGLAEEWIIHNGEADRVDREEFFSTYRGGGTVASTAHTLMLKIVEEEYPPTDWNLYIVYLSDGFNWGTDNETCKTMIRERILPIISGEDQGGLYAYGEVAEYRYWLREGGHGSFSPPGNYGHMIKEAFGNRERIAAAGLRTMEQVPDALKKYFKKAPQYSGDLD